MTTTGYSGTPLVKKLGIKEGSTLWLRRAPAEFRTWLVGLPADVEVRTRAAPNTDLTVWFVTRQAELDADFAIVTTSMGQGLWVAWPKKTSGVKTDVTEDTIRRVGLAHGLVDYKVCAISDVWSGLKFARRRR